MKENEAIVEDQDDFQWEIDEMEQREQEEIDSFAEEYY